VEVTVCLSDNLVATIGTVVTVLSFIYAIYENRRHAKLVSYNREQAWEIYRQTLKVLDRYQEIKKSKTDEDILKHTVEGEAYAQELLVSSIRMIKRFEKKFDSETIDKWHKEGKIPNESNVKAFKIYV
jgi:hypothetical protein